MSSFFKIGVVLRLRASVTLQFERRSQEVGGTKRSQWCDVPAVHAAVLIAFAVAGSSMSPGPKLTKWERNVSRLFAIGVACFRNDVFSKKLQFICLTPMACDMS